MTDNYSRFSRVADYYHPYRPRYPQQVITVLEEKCGLTPQQIVADVGAGTGLLTELFLEHGNRVYAVEPNADMRAVLESNLSKYDTFTSVEGQAEDTTLAAKSVHFVTAGQAFHWFEPDATRREFQRVLVPGGYVVLVWNLPALDDSAFSKAYEVFWRKYIAAEEMFEKRKRPHAIDAFFGAHDAFEVALENQQVCDFEAFKGRILSASRAPGPDDPRYPEMLDDLKAMFDAHNQDGKVTLLYDTRVTYGHIFGED